MRRLLEYKERSRAHSGASVLRKAVYQPNRPELRVLSMFQGTLEQVSPRQQAAPFIESRGGRGVLFLLMLAIHSFRLSYKHGLTAENTGNREFWSVEVMIIRMTGTVTRRSPNSGGPERPPDLDLWRVIRANPRQFPALRLAP